MKACEIDMELQLALSEHLVTELPRHRPAPLEVRTLVPKALLRRGTAALRAGSPSRSSFVNLANEGYDKFSHLSCDLARRVLTMLQTLVKTSFPTSSDQQTDTKLLRDGSRTAT
jgi:hypothetical protein